MVIVDRFFFDEIFMMDSSKDMDKMLVGFFLEGRFVFFFFSFGSEFIKDVFFVSYVFAFIWNLYEEFCG